MADYRAPVEDLRFLISSVFDFPSFWQSMPAHEELDMDTANAILEEAAKLCEQELAPLNRAGDEQGCSWVDGNVVAPEGFKQAYETFCEGGWNALGGDPQFDGMGMPKSLVAAVEEMVQGANMSFGLAPMLTAGASLAIRAHASEELQQAYLPKMYSGVWAGAMDLTEPHAGTDLGLIRTKAQPNDDGSYALTGTKIFITWGEHDMAENIIHLVLAKLPDAPPGVKGISLFLVPKFLPDADADADAEGNIGERNALECGSIEKKMGIKGSATCVMNFDGAKGWLVGEPHKGLACMFTMMNYERLVVGIQGVGAADASYQTALSYAKERRQGRSPAGAQNPDGEADSLLVHPDVRRMLMNMKSVTEASRAFYLYVARYLDQAKYAESPDERDLASNRVALLTPVAKAFLTDRALDACITGQQVLGGHGFVREWGQEQLVRDTRITQIYEGTNGVQAMDLVGRKTVGCKGALLREYLAEINVFVDEHSAENLAVLTSLAAAANTFDSTTERLLQLSEDSPEYSGAVAVDYLNALGILSFVYMWAQMSVTALSEQQSTFSDAKLRTAQYYCDVYLPEFDALTARIAGGSLSVMALGEEQF